MSASSGDAVWQSYLACRRVCRQAGSNFVGGFLLLPRGKRAAMDALYAFMRHTDDLADCDLAPDMRAWALSNWRADFEEALETRGQCDRPMSPVVERRTRNLGLAILPAVVNTVEQFRIPPELLGDVIKGVECDLEKRRYETFEELRQYCHLVASAVGLACIHVWGFRGPEAFEPARQCGVAMQLTNILRDVGDDLEHDRIYLPLEDMAAYDYTIADLNSRCTDIRFERLMAFEAERAESCYHEGAALLGLLNKDGRRVFGLMMGVYRALLHKIRARPEQVFRRRVRLSRVHKLLLAARWALLP